MNLGTLARRNMRRNKTRLILTILGIAIATILFVMLRTVLSSWTRGADVALKDRIVTRNKATFLMPLPLRYAEDMRSVPHVTNTTYARWFGGKDPAHDREFFLTFAIGPRYFEVFDDMV